MSDQNDVASILKDAWIRLMKQRHFDAAASIGVLSWLLAAKDGKGRSELRDGGIAFVKSAVGEASQESEPNHGCSFCGKLPPAVRIVQGAEGAICSECVQVAAGVFSRSE